VEIRGTYAGPCRASARSTCAPAASICAAACLALASTPSEFRIDELTAPDLVAVAGQELVDVAADR